MDELYSYLDIAELAGRFLKGEITQQERRSLDAWIAGSNRNKALWRKLTRQEYLEQQLESWEEMDPRAAWEKLLPAIRSVQTIEESKEAVSRRIHPLIRYAAAALVVLLAGSSYLVYKTQHHTPAPHIPFAVLRPPQPIPPGSHSAQLVLSSGKVIGLGPTGEQIREADGAKVESGRNKLTYATAGVNLADDTCYNTVITPRGGEYQLVLSDGTKVWLNAASSLRYPVCFTGKDRKVALVGEAYFEVAKSTAHPFVVTTRQSAVTVLGTSFNVKAYPDEANEKTSLLDGAVKVGSTVLQPGAQAVVDAMHNVTVSSANLEEALAWKNGLFIFQSESLESISRKLSRWYNVDIAFDDPSLKDIRFTGRIRRYEDMNALLKMIAATSRATFMQRGLTMVVGNK